MGTTAPGWTFVNRAHRVWVEDDATVSMPDHETVIGAVARLLKLKSQEPTETWFDGESLYKRLENGYVVCESYPGNSGIYQWPIMKVGMKVTVARFDGLLEHAYVSAICPDGNFLAEPCWNKFPIILTEHTIWWRLGHVLVDSKEAIELFEHSIQSNRQMIEDSDISPCVMKKVIQDTWEEALKLAEGITYKPGVTSPGEALDALIQEFQKRIEQ